MLMPCGDYVGDLTYQNRAKLEKKKSFYASASNIISFFSLKEEIIFSDKAMMDLIAEDCRNIL